MHPTRRRALGAASNQRLLSGERNARPRHSLPMHAPDSECKKDCPEVVGRESGNRLGDLVQDLGQLIGRAGCLRDVLSEREPPSDTHKPLQKREF